MPTRAERGVIHRDGFAIGYAIEGTGLNTLVLGSAIYHSRTFSAALRERLRFAFVDHRGFAEPPQQIDESSFQLDTLLDDFEAIREELDLGTVIAIGHSGQAYMALEYAKKYPDRVSHVVMIGIAPDLSADSAALVERCWQESVDPDRKAAMAANLVRWPDESLAGLALSDVFVRTNLRNGPCSWYDPHFDASELWDGVVPNEVLLRIWGGVFPRIDVSKGLADLHKPVLLALGRYDYVVAPACSWDGLRPKFRDLSVRVFERSGHTPQLEESRLFDSELLGWIASRS